MINKQIENELFIFTNNIFEFSKPKICPSTYIQIVYNPEAEMAYNSNNIIHINFDQIFKYYSMLYDNDTDNYLLYTKRFIAEIIIHELYHVEQSIVNVLYNTDKEYANDIERDTVYMTLIFLLQNSYYINQLGVIIDEFEIRCRLRKIFENYIPKYSRFINNDIEVYYINLIGCILSHAEKESGISYAKYFGKNISKIKNIILEINNCQYILKKNYEYNISYNELNSVINRYNPQFNYGRENIIVEVLYDNTSDTHIIRVVDFRKIELFKKSGGIKP